MKDFIGNELEIGDKVAYILKGYRELRIGYVVGFTNQKIRIGTSPDHVQSFKLQYSEQIVKIQ